MKIGFIYAIAAAVTWGLSYTLDEKILTTVSPVRLLFIHAIITALITFPFLFWSDGSIKEVLHSGKNNLAIIVASIILATVANFFIFSSIKALDASTASIMEIAYPFFVVLFSALLFRSIPNIYFFAGGLLIFIGSFVIIKFS